MLHCSSDPFIHLSLSDWQSSPNISLPARDRKEFGNFLSGKRQERDTQANNMPMIMVMLRSRRECCSHLPHLLRQLCSLRDWGESLPTDILPAAVAVVTAGCSPDECRQLIHSCPFQILSSCAAQQAQGSNFPLCPRTRLLSVTHTGS